MMSSKSHLLRPEAAVLLFSLAAACGSSNSGSAKDAGSAAKAGYGGSASSTTHGGTGGSAGHSGSGGSAADAGHGGSAANAGHGGSGGSAGSGGSGAKTPTVNLGTAADYVILAKSGISTVPPSVITGDLGVSPAKATSITMFSLTLDSTNVFSTTSQVTGKVYAADYAAPTPAKLTAAIGDMETAFTDAARRAASVTELGAGDIGGMTLAAGVYSASPHWRCC